MTAGSPRGGHGREHEKARSPGLFSYFFFGFFFASFGLPLSADFAT